MKAYLYIPFQQSPAVLGQIGQKMRDFVTEHATPKDLPTGWFRDPSLMVYSAFWADDEHLALAMTVRGEKDQEGRENPLTHVILSDALVFLANPISSLEALSDAIKSNEQINQSKLEDIFQASGVMLDETGWEAWRKRLEKYDEEFLLQAVSAIVKSPVTYVFYEKTKIQDFLDLMRLTYLLAGPRLRKDLTFVSTVDTFDAEEIWSRIRGYPVPSNGIEITKDEMSQIKKQKAALINLRKMKMMTKSKVLKSMEILYQELMDEPWLGLNKRDHVVIMHEVLQLHGKKKIEDINDYTRNLMRTFDRITKLRDLKDD